MNWEKMMVMWFAESKEINNIMKKNDYLVNEDTVAFEGRTFEKEGIRCFGWTDSGFTVSFDGTDLWVEIWTNQPNNDISRPYIGVLLDGCTKPEDMRVFPIDQEGWNFYPLAKSLPKGNHTLRLIKLSEGQQSIAKVKCLEVYGSLLKPLLTDRRHTVEFIGDSITTGFGNICPSQEGPFCTKEQDGWRTYAALTAQNLNLNFSIVAHSGRCIYKSPYGGSMPEAYELTDSQNGANECWDFQSNPVDLVVLNLGTNDGSWMSTQPEDKRAECAGLFMEAYVNFLRTIRAHNSNAIILCAIGMLYTVAAPYVEQAVEAACQQGLDRLYFVKLPQAISCGAGHPSAESHNRAAGVLEQRIRAITGW